jgi:hypothetical protein
MTGLEHRDASFILLSSPKLDDMISNPLESSTNIDNMISQHDNMIDSIIYNLEKSSDSKKDKYKLN